MITRTKHRRTGVGAGLVALLVFGFVGAAHASTDEVVSSDAQAPVSLVAFDNDVMATLDMGQLDLAHRYGPPPPRYRHYRVYRPYWRVRVVPPPLFAPGWFGFYFLGVQPPPPAAPAPRAATPPPPDFRHVRQYSLTVSAGAYGGQYLSGPEYSDPGVRFALAYRNAPVVGAEFAVGLFGSDMRYDGMGSDVRSDIPIQLSVVLHAFPRSPIQPYFLFGGTGDLRTYRKYNGAEYGDLYGELRVGPHVGLGIEFLVGRNVSITVDGRSIHYTLIDRRAADQTVQNDVTGTLGMSFYF